MWFLLTILLRRFRITILCRVGGQTRLQPPNEILDPEHEEEQISRFCYSKIGHCGVLLKLN